MPDDLEPEVTNNVERQRYELRVDGEVAGIAEYDEHGDQIVFTHTEVDPKFEGQGIGGRLARAALEDARRRRLQVVPVCPFMAEYITRHPEYADLAPPH